MSKKILLIIVLLVLIIILMLWLLIASQSAKKSATNTQPAPSYSSSPIPPPTGSVSPDMGKEQQAEQNYAKARQDFLNEKPWISKLPLSSNDYFVSYDPQNDTLLVSIYYSTSSSEPQDQQLQTAKNDAMQAILSAGVDTNKQKIEFTEAATK